MIKNNSQHRDGTQPVNFRAICGGRISTHMCSLTRVNRGVLGQISGLYGDLMEGVSQIMPKA
jgi:hypothetical protein